MVISVMRTFSTVNTVITYTTVKTCTTIITCTTVNIVITCTTVNTVITCTTVKTVVICTTVDIVITTGVNYDCPTETGDTRTSKEGKAKRKPKYIRAIRQRKNTGLSNGNG